MTRSYSLLLLSWHLGGGLGIRRSGSVEIGWSDTQHCVSGSCTGSPHSSAIRSKPHASAVEDLWACTSPDNSLELS